MIMYLYEDMAEVSVHRPSFNTSSTEVMLLSKEVKGDTTLASESLRAIPTCAIHVIQYMSFKYH